MVRFERAPGFESRAGRLTYSEEDQSFLFHDASDLVERSGMACLTVGRLQLHIAVDDALLVFVDGFHPRSLWREGTVVAPTAQPGQVKVSSNEPLLSGVGIELAADGSWNTLFDASSGLIMISNPNCVGTIEPSIEIATGQTVALSGTELCRIWLAPHFEP